MSISMQIVTEKFNMSNERKLSNRAPRKKITFERLLLERKWYLLTTFILFIQYFRRNEGLIHQKTRGKENEKNQL